MFYLQGVRFKDILHVEELKISAGKITCIIGESGSGKTTLLRLLNGLISPDSGQIYYHETDLNNWDFVQLRRQVVMLSQKPVIFPGTIRDNLLMGLHFAEKPARPDDELLEIMARVKLPKKLAGDASELSGGEKQRVALGRVLLMQPEVMLLDEPTSALDDDTGELIMDEVVRDAGERKKTAVVVTHSRKLARRYGEMIVTVEKGKIAAVEVVER